jgi:hypothetical protein
MSPMTTSTVFGTQQTFASIMPAETEEDSKSLC